MPDATAASSGSTNTLDFRDAASTGDLQRLKTVVEDILRAGKTVDDVRDGEMATALHLAANSGHTSVCSYLVNGLKMRVDPKDSYGETPLYRAVSQGHLETVEYLLGEKADLSAKPSTGYSMLHNAARIGDVAMMRLLLNNRAGVDSICHGCTPLICAIRHGHVAAVELLLEHKADPNAKTAEVLPLSAAITVNSSLCFEALLKKGADIGALTLPLHAAARCGATTVLKHLIKNCDPNVYDDEGLKPIQVGALKDNLEVVNFLFPHTSRIPKFSEWTTAAMKQQTLLKIAQEKDNKRKLSESKNLSDEEILQRLEKMIVKDKEVNFFAEWSAMKRRLFYETMFTTLPKFRRVTNVHVGTVQNSTIFDTTSENMHEVQESYLSAICHYRAWHFAGSDDIFEYGNGERFCISRKDQTFIFWFRYKDQDVGLVIDGQRLWVEGFIRRICHADGTFTYNNHAVQFRDESDTSDEGDKPTSTSNKPSYIQGSDVELVNYSGSYKKSITQLKLDIHFVRKSIDKVTSYTRNNLSFEALCHESADVLVLYSTEAGKNHWVFQYTMASMDPGRVKPIQVPGSLHWTVVKHEKSTRSGLVAIKKEFGESVSQDKDCDKATESGLEAAADCDENKEEHGKSNAECDETDEFYNIVHGAPFRKLSQCVDAYVIFRREKFFDTKFYLSEMTDAYRSQLKSRRMAKQQAGTSEVDEEIVLKERLSKGTLFSSDVHGGLTIYRGDVRWPMPPNPSSRSKWYHCDDTVIS